MWKETERFRVRDESGAIQIAVKMTKTLEKQPLVGKWRAIPEVAFYFLLDSSNVTPLPDGTFRNDETGQILRRI